MLDYNPHGTRRFPSQQRQRFSIPLIKRNGYNRLLNTREVVPQNSIMENYQILNIINYN